MSTWETVLTLLGLGVVTLITRCFFLWPQREIPLPAWLQRGLKVTPLAALFAIIAPEILMTQGALIETWRDARWPAAALATAWYCWRPGVLGPLLVGLATFLPLRLGLGW